MADSDFAPHAFLEACLDFLHYVAMREGATMSQETGRFAMACDAYEKWLEDVDAQGGADEVTTFAEGNVRKDEPNTTVAHLEVNG